MGFTKFGTGSINSAHVEPPQQPQDQPEDQDAQDDQGDGNQQ